MKFTVYSVWAAKHNVNELFCKISDKHDCWWRTLWVKRKKVKERNRYLKKSLTQQTSKKFWRWAFKLIIISTFFQTPMNLFLQNKCRLNIPTVGMYRNSGPIGIPVRFQKSSGSGSGRNWPIPVTVPAGSKNAVPVNH